MGNSFSPYLLQTLEPGVMLPISHMQVDVLKRETSQRQYYDHKPTDLHIPPYQYTKRSLVPHNVKNKCLTDRGEP